MARASKLLGGMPVEAAGRVICARLNARGYISGYSAEEIRFRTDKRVVPTVQRIEPFSQPVVIFYADLVHNKKDRQFFAPPPA